MASNQLKNVFLSASIPLPEGNPRYYSSADVIAIRDAVIALASTVLPIHRITWGGHPSITPLINYVMQKLELNIQEHVTIYQSRYFENSYPDDNNKFKNIIQIDASENKEGSLFRMRMAMIKSQKFDAGVFIGGMEGVEQEYKIFKQLHPNSIIIPLASTGAAAAIIYENLEKQNVRFKNDYAYMSLYQDYLLKNL